MMSSSDSAACSALVCFRSRRSPASDDVAADLPPSCGIRQTTLHRPRGSRGLLRHALIGLGDLLFNWCPRKALLRCHLLRCLTGGRRGCPGGARKALLGRHLLRHLAGGQRGCPSGAQLLRPLRLC
jgi:hypothetical protein